MERPISHRVPRSVRSRTPMRTSRRSARTIKDTQSSRLPISTSSTSNLSIETMQASKRTIQHRSAIAPRPSTEIQRRINIIAIIVGRKDRVSIARNRRARIMHARRGDSRFFTPCCTQLRDSAALVATLVPLTLSKHINSPPSPPLALSVYLSLSPFGRRPSPRPPSVSVSRHSG